jgi:hypothetical protein
VRNLAKQENDIVYFEVCVFALVSRMIYSSVTRRQPDFELSAIALPDAAVVAKSQPFDDVPPADVVITSKATMCVIQ